LHQFHEPVLIPGSDEFDDPTRRCAQRMQ
jgi:hypothetical protein